MSDTYNPVVKLSGLELHSHAKGKFARSTASIAQHLRLSRLPSQYIEVPPGKSFCPFHVHMHQDEMFIILSGKGEYRFGEERYPVEAGDVLGAPMGGADYAHQLWNTGDEPLKYIAISSATDADVCLYPDSDKFAVFNENPLLPEERQFDFMGRKEMDLDYYDGEESADE